MAPMTEVRQHGPRLSYAEYLEAATASAVGRTGD